MKRTALFFVFMLFAVGGASAVKAQGIERVRDSLAFPDPFTHARVEVVEQGDAAAAIRTADHNAVRARTVGYGVSLFRDNSQTARDNAEAARAQFAEMYPEIPVQVSYKSPFFTVSAGNFADRTDAVALCGKVLGRFPKAVVIQEDITH